MEYRVLGRTGIEVSAIGLGMEHMHRRSPRTMEAVLRAAIDGGITFVDLLYETGAFWEKFGNVYRRYRDQFVLAVHWGGAHTYDTDYSRRCFDGVLERLGAETVQIAMITMVDTDAKWETLIAQVEGDLLQYKREGRIQAIGVSGHHAPTLERVVKSGLVDVCMAPVSLVTQAYPPHLLPHVRAGLDRLFVACQTQGVGMVGMKVYNGGLLLDRRRSPCTPVHCLHYALEQPLSTVAVGVQGTREVAAALQYNVASEEDRDYRRILWKVPLDVFEQCVYCGHCLPCPEGIDIPGVMQLASMIRLSTASMREIRANYVRLPVKASACTECGVCLERCAFDVDIIPRLREAAALVEYDIG
jgi:uncharacterized protein